MAGPIIISNLSVPLVGIVDTAVVGHLPNPDYIGAVALGAVIFNFVYWGFGFLRMGTTGFIAQCFGRGDYTEIRNLLCRAFFLSAVLGLAIIVLQLPINGIAFWLLEGSIEVEGYASEYFKIRVWGAPAALATYVILGTLIGMHNARATLVLQLILNGTNIILDILFVTVFHWNVAGVAWATLISEYLAMAAGLWLLFDHRIRGTVDIRHALTYSRIKALLQVNINIFIRTIFIIFAFSYFTALSTKLGSVLLAANAVLLHLNSLMAYGLDGFAHAAEALVGSEYGKRNRQGFRLAVKISTLWALITGLLFTATFYFWGDDIVALITNINEVKTTANQYMLWVILLPMISVWSFQLDGIFIGTTHTREMRNGMIISTLVYLPCTWLFVDWWHNHGLWFSLTVFMILRAVTLGFWYGRIESSMKQN